MIIPDPRTIEAIASLEHNRDFAVFREWFEDSLQDATDKAIEQNDEVEIRLAQGEARSLRETLKHMDQAREYIRRSRKD